MRRNFIGVVLAGGLLHAAATARSLHVPRTLSYEDDGLSLLQSSAQQLPRGARDAPVASAPEVAPPAPQLALAASRAEPAVADAAPALPRAPPILPATDPAIPEQAAALPPAAPAVPEAVPAISDAALAMSEVVPVFPERARSAPFPEAAPTVLEAAPTHHEVAPAEAAIAPPFIPKVAAPPVVATAAAAPAPRAAASPAGAVSAVPEAAAQTAPALPEPAAAPALPEAAAPVAVVPAPADDSAALNGSQEIGEVSVHSHHNASHAQGLGQTVASIVAAMTASKEDVPMKNKVTLMILELIPPLGMLGIDRLYLEAYATGLIKMAVCICTCIIGGTVWYFVDGIAVMLNAFKRSSSINTLGMHAHFNLEQMDTAQTLGWILLAVWVLLVIFTCLFFKNRKPSKDEGMIPFGAHAREGFYGAPQGRRPVPWTSVGGPEYMHPQFRSGPPTGFR